MLSNSTTQIITQFDDMPPLEPAATLIAHPVEATEIIVKSNKRKAENHPSSESKFFNHRSENVEVTRASISKILAYLQQCAGHPNYSELLSDFYSTLHASLSTHVEWTTFLNSYQYKDLATSIRQDILSAIKNPSLDHLTKLLDFNEYTKDKENGYYNIKIYAELVYRIGRVFYPKDFYDQTKPVEFTVFQVKNFDHTWIARECWRAANHLKHVRARSCLDETRVEAEQKAEASKKFKTEKVLFRL